MKIAVVAAGFLAASFTTARPAHAQDASAGERMFRQRCASCHTIQPGQNRIGPHLAGIVGRKPGSVEGARYSKGLSALEPNWDATNLDAFLASPCAVARAHHGPQPPERGNIVVHLQSLTSANWPQPSHRGALCWE